MKSVLRILSGLLLIAIALGGAPAAAAQSAVSLSLEPATLAVAPEGEFTIAVILNSGQQLIDGAQIALAYDPSRLSVLSLTPGTALPDVFQQGHDNTTGRVLYAAGKMLGELPKGRLELFKVQFRALSTGASLLEFAADLPLQTKATSGGQNLALDLAASQITVSAGASVAATATQQPTATNAASATQPATATPQPTQVAQANTPAPTTARTGYPAPRTNTPASQAATATSQATAPAAQSATLTRQPTSTRVAQPSPSVTTTRPPDRTLAPAATATSASIATQTRAPVTPQSLPVTTATAPAPTALPSLAALTPIGGQFSENATAVPDAAAEAESRSTLSTLLSVLAIIAIAAVVIAFAFVRRRWLVK